jgi:hypothetical protein
MSLDEAAQRITAIPRDRIDGLLRILKSPGNFDWYLAEPHPQEDRLQGDIHVEFPTAFVGPDGLPRFRKFPIIIINNTCDLQPERSQFVSVAPILDFEFYKDQLISRKSAPSAENTIRDLKANRIFDMLWIPPVKGFTSGAVALLSNITSASSMVLERSIASGQRIASLSEKGFYTFLIQITRFLARPESSEIAPRHDVTSSA